MLHSSSSCGTCYEKLFWACHVRVVVSKILCRLSRWEAGNIKKNECGVRTTYHGMFICTRTKCARVRPTSRAYGDADPGLVGSTATCAAAAAAAAVMVREAHCCCGCRTSVQVKLLWLLLRKISSFCWTKQVICRFFVLKLLL